MATYHFYDEKEAVYVAKAIARLKKYPVSWCPGSPCSVKSTVRGYIVEVLHQDWVDGFMYQVREAKKERIPDKKFEFKPRPTPLRKLKEKAPKI